MFRASPRALCDSLLFMTIFLRFFYYTDVSAASLFMMSCFIFYLTFLIRIRVYGTTFYAAGVSAFSPTGFLLMKILEYVSLPLTLHLSFVN